MNTSAQLYDLLKETFLLLDNGDQQVVEYFNLSIRRYYTLYWINEEPGISFRDLSLRMLVDKSNVTRIIKALEKEGLVYREAHETDGRSARLYLTETGQTLCQQVVTAHKASIPARISQINLSEQDNLISQLSKLNNSLRQSLAQSVIPQT